MDGIRGFLSRSLPSEFFFLILLAVLVGFGLSAKPEPAATNCPTPGDTQVVLWQHARFKGVCSVLDRTTRAVYSSSTAFGLANDSLSSIQVGRKVRATLFEHARFSGLRITFSVDALALSDFSLNDRVSAVRLEPRDMNCLLPGDDQVAIFQHADLQQPGDCYVLDKGTYSRSSDMGFADNSVSSMKIGRGVKVYACSDRDFLGRCEMLTGTVLKMSRTRVGNDALSSLRVD